MKSVAVLACSLENDHLSRHAGVVDADNLGAPRAAAVGILGHAGRCWRLVEREYLRIEVAAGQLSFQPHPTLRLAGSRRSIPVLHDGRGVHHENVCAVRPFVDGVVQPVEVRPPERLVLALVIAAGGGDQGDCRLFGRAVTGGGIAGELRQRRRELVVVFDGVVFGNRLNADRCDARFPGEHQQPVP